MDIDDVDLRLYDYQKSETQDKSFKIITSETKKIDEVQNVDGEELTQAEIEGIKRCEIMALCYQDLSFLYRDIEEMI